MINAFALSEIEPESKILIALLNESEADNTHELLKKQGLNIKKCLDSDKFSQVMDSKIIVTTHRVLA